MERGTVLIVDDEAFVRESLQEVLRANGFDVLAASGGDEAARILGTASVDAVVTDLRMPAGDGLALLKAARTEGRGIPILVLTGAGTVGDAVQAMKAGAYDLLEKPIEPQRLVRIVRNAIERSALQREVRGLREALLLQAEGRSWVGSSSAGRRVAEAIERAGRSDLPVLVHGGSGTGKEVVAEEIHRASARARGPFVRVDCAALDSAALSQMLFGHKKGGFPGAKRERIGRVALAHEGTLLLDEVATLALDMQARLLGLLERGVYERLGEERPLRSDLRVIATTNADLALLVQEGAFREDLRWRLEALPIAVPSLAERRADLAPLCTALLRELAARQGRGCASKSEVVRLSGEALELLDAYSWPGNVRELRNVLGRALLTASGETIAAEDVSGALDPELARGSGRAGAEHLEDLRIRSNTDKLERSLILTALARTEGRRTEAANLLGVDARNLGYYLRKHRITEEEIQRAVRE